MRTAISRSALKRLAPAGVLVAATLVLTAFTSAGTATVTNGKIAFTRSVDAGQIWSSAPSGARATRLVSGPGVHYQGVPSPDGSRLVYASDRDGDAEIFVSRPDGSEPVRVTDNAVGDWDPAWSPDGRRIAFASERDGDVEIYTAAVGGGDVRRLTTRRGDDWNPSWSRRGLIAFWNESGANADVYAMRADGSRVKRLTTSHRRELFPAWSPDGSTLVYTVEGDDGYSLWTMRPDGSSKRSMRTAGVLAAWSPDGKRIAATRFASFERPEIVVINRATRKVLSRIPSAYGPAWSGNERLVYTRVGFENEQVATANVDGSDVRLVAATAAYEGEPTWSPDGKTIAFAAGADVDEADLFAVDGDGGTARRLLRLDGFQGDPAWCPDGRRIAFTSDGELFVLDVASSLYRRLDIDDDSSFEPSWAPDGRRIVFEQVDVPLNALVVFDTDSEMMTKLPVGKVDPWAPDWSPDGSSVAYSAEGDIWVISLATGVSTRVTTGKHEDSNPEWSPDGRLIAFDRGFVGGGRAIFTIAADGSALTRLAFGPDPVSEPSWQPVRTG